MNRTTRTRERFTIRWTTPTNITRVYENEPAARIEGIGRLLNTRPGITDIAVLNKDGDDCTFDFEFACI